MELNEMKSLWLAYDLKLDKALKLNQHFLELMQGQKVRSKLAPLFWQKVAEVVLQAASIVLLMMFLYYNFSQMPYAFSAIVLIAFYTVAFLNSFKQLMIIKRMDYSNDIVTIQSGLVMLESRTLNYAKMVILCIPAFLAFPPVVTKAIIDLHLTSVVHFDIITASHRSWWKAQLASSIVLIPLCVWVYMQLSYKNINKKWVKDFIQRSSGKRVKKAMEFINELESLKH